MAPRPAQRIARHREHRKTKNEKRRTNIPHNA
jgi:hypothetical protein